MHLEKGTAFHVCCHWVSLLQFVLQTLRILWRYLLKAFPADVSCLPGLHSKVFAPVLWLPTKRLKRLELCSVFLNANVNKAIFLLNADIVKPVHCQFTYYKAASVFLLPHGWIRANPFRIEHILWCISFSGITDHINDVMATELEAEDLLPLHICYIKIFIYLNF